MSSERRGIGRSSAKKHSQRIQKKDSGFDARNLALTLLIDIDERDLYANLATPERLRDSNLEPRDRAFVTELVYGTLRRRGLYDEIIKHASGRNISKIDKTPLQILRMTAHQLLSLKTPAHAAVDGAVRLVVRNGSGSASGFVNAIARRISERSIEEWISLLTENLDEISQLSIQYSHPQWIVDEYALRLVDLDKVRVELDANNTNPRITGVIYPGEEWSSESIERSDPAEWVSDCRYFTGNPEELSEIRRGTAGIQDQGSYLVSQALAKIPTEATGCWIDLCAGPGGKAALLSRWATMAGKAFAAVEISEHRARLMSRVTAAIVVADGTKPPFRNGIAEKVLVDAPCSGLGALRRRPDARHRKKNSEIDSLVEIQRALLTSAIDLLQSGGILAYVTCSPVLRETRANTEWIMEKFPNMELVDARAYFPSELPLGERFDVQLWPGIHGTDAMYLALFRKN